MSHFIAHSSSRLLCVSGLCQVVTCESEEKSTVCDVQQETVQLMQRLNSLNPVFEAIDKNLKEIEVQHSAFIFET